MQRLFWKYFFRLVVFTGAVAQWAVLAWIVVVVGGVSLPWPAHLVGPLLFHLLNRSVLQPRPGASDPRRRRLERAYIGVVFTCLFGLLALLANGLVWGSVAAALHSASLAGFHVAAADVVGPAGVTGTMALLFVSAALAHGYGPGQGRVRVLEIDVAVTGLPAAFDGFRLVQLSDIHLGNFMDEVALATHVDLVNGLGADLVCITGDITDGLGHAERTFPVLGRLRARCGVVATLGNHDFYTGADEVTATLRRLTPIRVLRNETLMLEAGGERLHILGVDDAGLDWARGVREHEALPPLAARVDPGEAAILLSHRPDLFAQAAGFGIALVLSGHTHGGQLALPWPTRRPTSLAHFITDFPRGTYALGGSTLHVNLGLGVTGQPVRVFSPREVTVITLRPTPIHTNPTGDPA